MLQISITLFYPWSFGPMSMPVPAGASDVGAVSPRG